MAIRTGFWAGFDWISMLWILLIPLCLVTCDDCSGCRENAKSLYCSRNLP